MYLVWNYFTAILVKAKDIEKYLWSIFHLKKKNQYSWSDLVFEFARGRSKGQFGTNGIKFFKKTKKMMINQDVCSQLKIFFMYVLYFCLTTPFCFCFLNEMLWWRVFFYLKLKFFKFDDPRRLNRFRSHGSFSFQTDASQSPSCRQRNLGDFRGEDASPLTSMPRSPSMEGGYLPLPTSTVPPTSHVSSVWRRPSVSPPSTPLLETSHHGGGRVSPRHLVL